MEYHFFMNSDDEKAKLIFERAMNNVGQHMHSSEIWQKYIDYELTLNHLALVNLLYYLSIRTPLLGTDLMLNK